MIEASLPQRLQHLESHIQELENGANPDERDRVRALLQTVLDLHGTALARLLDLISQGGEPGRQILQSAGQDELVRSLLLLHGLYSQDLETRVVQALDKVRPFLHSQGADVQLAAIAEDAVRLHLQRDEDGYPATLQTLRAAVEEALCAAAPDVRQVEYVDPLPARFPLPVLTGRTTSSGEPQ